MSAMDKVNGFLAKLPFVKLAGNIPEGIRGKIPVLNLLIPFANHIASGVAVVVLVACIGGGGGGGTGGGGRGGPTASAEKDFKYELTEDGSGVKITGVNVETPAHINIPDTIEGYPVTQIAWGSDIGNYRVQVGTQKDANGNNVPVYEIRNSVVSITIPKTVTKLSPDPNPWGIGAFSNKPLLKNITLPPNLTEIPDYCFSGSGLTSVTIPSGITKIGTGAFHNCDNLEKIVIPEGVTTIEGGAFSGCANIREVTIPDSVTEIGSGAFSGGPELTTVNLPSHPITYIEGLADPSGSAFENNPKLSLATRKKIQDTGYTGDF